jgi:hypothetical protein
VIERWPAFSSRSRIQQGKFFEQAKLVRRAKNSARVNNVRNRFDEARSLNHLFDRAAPDTTRRAIDTICHCEESASRATKQSMQPFRRDGSPFCWPAERFARLAMTELGAPVPAAQSGRVHARNRTSLPGLSAIGLATEEGQATPMALLRAATFSTQLQEGLDHTSRRSACHVSRQRLAVSNSLKRLPSCSIR